jgi:hypothetical protein
MPLPQPAGGQEEVGFHLRCARDRGRYLVHDRYEQMGIASFHPPVHGQHTHPRALKITAGSKSTYTNKPSGSMKTASWSLPPCGHRCGPYFTRPGLFQITEKKATETMQGALLPAKPIFITGGRSRTMYFDQLRTARPTGAHGSAFHSLTAASIFPLATRTGCSTGQMWATGYTYGIPPG